MEHEWLFLSASQFQIRSAHIKMRPTLDAEHLVEAQKSPEMNNLNSPKYSTSSIKL